MIFKTRKNPNYFLNKAFTLIELLVVVAIIGILAGIVLASLNSARERGRVAAIKSNLINTVAQAEISYDDNGNYSQVCTSIAPMLASVTNNGVSASCYTHTTTGDVYQRWGASAINSDGTINLSVNSNGVVTWGTHLGVVDGTGQWNLSSDACAAIGQRLPSLEELKSQYDAYGSTPPGFVPSAWYWSGTSYPPDSSRAYMFLGGSIATNIKTGTGIRTYCVY